VKAAFLIPALSAAVAYSLVATRASAEQTASLAAAEAAYLQIDFEGTSSACQAALKEGTHDSAETLRLYTLLGIAASSLGEESEAKEAFRRVIAIDPAAGLEKTLSPKVRAPYLEVRGDVMAKGELTPLHARLLRQAGHLALELDDPAEVTSSIDVAYRIGASAKVARWHLARQNKAVQSEALPDTSRVEYTLTVRDAYGNALFRAGSDAAPEVLAPIPAAIPAAHVEGPPPPNRTPYYVTAGLLAAGGVAAGVAGAVFHVQREEAAHEWNSSACEHPGETRGEQCADVDQRRQTAQNLALGFYAGSGALLIGSLITLLVAPSSAPGAEPRAALPCVPGVGTLGAACRIAF
jgi:tetratricopeptide (TPR) repeat protein